MVTAPRNDGDRKALARRVLENNRAFESMEANPDFLEWREKGPYADMEALRSAAFSVDRSDPTWKERVCEMVVEYQAVDRAMRQDVRRKGSDAARRALKELEAKDAA